MKQESKESFNVTNNIDLQTVVFTTLNPTNASAIATIAIIIVFLRFVHVVTCIGIPFLYTAE